MLIIADNLQITHPAIERAVLARDPAPIRDMAARCAAAGAHAIDINAGPLRKDGEAVMEFLVAAVRSGCNLPVCLDTVNPSAMEAGLKAAGRRAVINGISLQPRKIEGFLPLARSHDADVICFLLKRDGHVPPDASGRLEAAVDLAGVLTGAGISRERLILDPVAAPLMWDDGGRQAWEVLETVRLLPEVLGFDVRVMAGLSNLTTGRAAPQSKRLLIERTYLAMLAGAGISCVLMNVFHPETVATARAAQALTSRGIFSWYF